VTSVDEPSTDRPRPPLTPERIVAAAIAFADEHGLDELSMRKLARSLGYEVMSLYNHVASKDAMIAAMLEAVAAEMPRPAPGPDWKAQLRRAMIGGFRVMQAHPWVVPIWNTRIPGPSRLALMESMLATLMSAGLSAQRADHGFHALSTHLQGFALQEQAFTLPAGDPAAMVEDFKRSLDPQRHASVIAHVEWHQTNPQPQEFEFVLDLILDGLESANSPVSMPLRPREP
jgi:AcrR family transcriptional regulator